MIRSGISQDGYPRKIIIDKDTVCALTIPQVDSINIIIVNLDQCHELNDSLNSELANYGDLVNEQKLVIDSKDKELIIQKKIVSAKDSIIVLDEKIIKGHDRKVTWLKVQRTALTGIAIALTSYIIYIKLEHN